MSEGKIFLTWFGVVKYQNNICTKQLDCQHVIQISQYCLFREAV
jgi:hypothetical protein